MAQKDSHNNQKSAVLIAPVVFTADASYTSAIVDTRGFESVDVCFAAGIITAEAATVTPTFEQSDAVTFTAPVAIDASMLINKSVAGNPAAGVVFTGADDSKNARIGLLNKKRYIRVTLAVSGMQQNQAIPMSVTAILGNPSDAPTSEDK